MKSLAVFLVLQLPLIYVLVSGEEKFLYPWGRTFIMVTAPRHMTNFRKYRLNVAMRSDQRNPQILYTAYGIARLPFNGRFRPRANPSGGVLTSTHLVPLSPSRDLNVMLYRLTSRNFFTFNVISYYDVRAPQINSYVVAPVDSFKVIYCIQVESIHPKVTVFSQHKDLTLHVVRSYQWTIQELAIRFCPCKALYLTQAQKSEDSLLIIASHRIGVLILGHVRKKTGSKRHDGKPESEQMATPMTLWGKVYLWSTCFPGESGATATSLTVGTTSVEVRYYAENNPKQMVVEIESEDSKSFRFDSLIASSARSEDQLCPLSIVSDKKIVLEIYSYKNPYLHTSIPKVELFNVEYVKFCVRLDFEKAMGVVILRTTVENDVLVNGQPLRDIATAARSFEVTFRRGVIQNEKYTSRMWELNSEQDGYEVRCKDTVNCAFLLYVLINNPSGEQIAPQIYRYSPVPKECTLTNTVPGDGVDNDCDRRIDEEKADGVDNDKDGKIDEDLASPTAVKTCTVTHTVPGDGVDNDCDGQIDEEKEDGLDNDEDGRIDEDLFPSKATPQICTVTDTVPGDGVDNDCDGQIDEEKDDGMDNDNDDKVDEDLAKQPSIAGGWGEWTRWICRVANCSADSGKMTRKRYCDNPRPSFNGPKCSGISEENSSTVCQGHGTCYLNCSDGKFGWGCTKRCSAECLNDTCTKLHGDCLGCNPGYENDETCAHECHIRFYGADCASMCPYECFETCDHRTGSCLKFQREDIAVSIKTLLLGLLLPLIFTIPCCIILLYLFSEHLHNDKKRAST